MQEKRLEAEQFLAAPPDAFGDIEVGDGLVIHNMAQSELHDLVVRRLAAAFENARPAEGPCFRRPTPRPSVSCTPLLEFPDIWSSISTRLGADQRDRGVPPRLVWPPLRRARRASPGADTG